MRPAGFLRIYSWKWTRITCLRYAQLSLSLSLLFPLSLWAFACSLAFFLSLPSSLPLDSCPCLFLLFFCPFLYQNSSSIVRYNVRLLPALFFFSFLFSSFLNMYVCYLLQWILMTSTYIFIYTSARLVEFRLLFNMYPNMYLYRSTANVIFIIYTLSVLLLYYNIFTFILYLYYFQYFQ